MKRKTTIYTVMLILMLALLTAADQITKFLAKTHLQGNDIPLIRHVLYLVYVENTGAAFGLFKGFIPGFVLLAIVACSVCLVLAVRSISRGESLLFTAGLLLAAAGSLGNLTDRILHRYVIDFIYFSPIDFPVFNLADIFVCIGCALIGIYVITTL